MKRSLLFSLLTILTLACSTTRCRDQNRGAVPEPTNASQVGVPDPNKATDLAVKSSSTVRVYKYDSSKQCGEGKGIDLDVMERQLKGIKVLSREKRNDGKMRIQMCGSATGDANVYEIPAADLRKAVKAGFQEWTFN